MSLETRRDWILKSISVVVVLWRRCSNIVSSFDLLDFSSRMSWVIKGLCNRDEHVIVLSGACLSRVDERTELKR